MFRVQLISQQGVELLRLSSTDRYQVIAALDDTYPVSYMCERLGVTRSKYYAWCQRGGASTRELEDRRLRTLMRVIHAEWGGIFGYRRMREILRTQHDEWLGERRVRRLMGEASLWGVPLKKRRHRRAPGDRR